MKKLYLLGALVLALTVAVFAKTTRTHVYEWPSEDITISESVDDQNWTKKYSGMGFTFPGTKVFTLMNTYSYEVDSWLVSPAFNVVKGREYEITFEHKGNNTNASYVLDVCFTATSPLVNADATLEATQQNFPVNTAYESDTYKVTAESDGKMYFVFHATNVTGGLLIRNVKIDELVTEEEPDQPEVPEGPHDCAGVSTPYAISPATSSSQLTAGWTMLNNNEDNKYWEAASESSFPSKYGAKISYTTSTGLDHDDYLYSPAIHLDRDKEYIVSYWVKAGSGSYKEKLAVYMSESKEPEEVKSSHCIMDYGEFLITSAKKESFTFTPEKTGDYYLVFYAYSEKDKMSIYIGDVLVSENIFAPAAVTSFTATPGAYRALTCQLHWTLPTTDVFGATLPADKPISAVKVYRDEEHDPIATLAADATSFQDSETTGLTSGYHTYYVSVVADDVEGAKASVATSYVGPIAPFAVPADFTFTTEDDFSMWDTYNGTNASSSLKWVFDPSNKVAKFAMSGSNKADHYFITPPLTFTEPGYYRVTWTAFTSEKETRPAVDLYLVDNLNINTAEKVNIGAQWILPNGYTSDAEPKTTVCDFRVETVGQYYIATRISSVTTASTYANSFFKEFKVEKSQFVPATVTELTATPDEDGANEIKVTWVNPEKDFAGLDMSADQYKVEIYLNDAETPAMTITDGTNEVIVPVAEAGIYTVTVKTVSTDGNSTTAPEAPALTTSWVGSRFVTLPYETEFEKEDDSINIWNFIDANYSTYSTNYTFFHNTTSEYLTLEKGNGVTYKDYAMSPKMHLTPGYYKLTLTHKGGYTTTYGTSYIWNPIIGLSQAVEADTHTVPELVINLPTDVLNGSSYTPKEYSAVLHVDAEGDYQVAYGISQYASQSPYESYLPQLCSFKFEATEVFPGDVTDLAAVVDKDVNTTVHISWTNPTTIKGTEIQIDEIKSVVIERDGELVATITEGLTPGEEASYDDEDVPAGLHEYTVFCAIDGKGYAPEGDGVPTHAEVYPTITTGWVGDGLSAPVNHHQNFPGWTTHDENSDADASEAGKYAWTMKNTYMFIYGYNKNHNDYLVSCPMNIEENVVYKVSYFTATPMDGLTNDIAVPVKIGKDADHKDFTTVSSIALTSTQDRYTYNWHTFYVMVDDKEAEESEEEEQPSPEAVKARAPEADATDEPTTFEDFAALAAKVPSAGAHRFALHFTEPGGMRVQSFKFEEAAKKQIQTGLDAVEAAGVAFDGDALCFAGEADVKVFNVAGACVANETAHDGFSFEGFAPGYYIVKVTVDGETTTLKVAVK